MKVCGVLFKKVEKNDNSSVFCHTNEKKKKRWGDTFDLKTTIQTRMTRMR